MKGFTMTMMIFKQYKNRSCLCYFIGHCGREAHPNSSVELSRSGFLAAEGQQCDEKVNGAILVGTQDVLYRNASAERIEGLAGNEVQARTEDDPVHVDAANLIAHCVHFIIATGQFDADKLPQHTPPNHLPHWPSADTAAGLNFSNEWLKDRAELLERKNYFNANDTEEIRRDDARCQADSGIAARTFATESIAFCARKPCASGRFDAEKRVCRAGKSRWRDRTFCQAGAPARKAARSPAA